MGIGTGLLIVAGLILVGAVLYWRLSSSSDALPRGARREMVIESKVTHRAQIRRADGQEQIVYDGVPYKSLQEIPDPTSRQAVQEALDKATQTPPGPLTKTQVTVSQTFVVNGVTYHSLDEIPDPKLRERIAQALKKVE